MTFTNLALLWVLGTTTAQAPKGAIFEVDSVRDGFSLFALIGVGILIDREKLNWEGQSACERSLQTKGAQGSRFCDPSQVNALDRFVTELNSPTARWLSDVGVATMIALPFAVSAIEAGTGDFEKPGLRFGEDALVIGQTLGATLLISSALKVIVRRPRPLTYNGTFDSEDRLGGDARLSFPSGHSSFSFSSASLTTVMLAERHGRSAITFVGAAGSYLLAATVAFLRVAGGKHFVTDVVAGALLGTGLGLAVPLLHRIGPDDGGAQRAGVATSMSPVISFTGAW